MGLAGGYDVAAAGQSDFAFDDAKKCTIKRFDKIVATAATHDIVDAVASKKIRIRSICVRVLSTTSVGVYFKTADDATSVLLGTDSSNKQTLDADGVDGPPGFILQQNPDGWAETSTANKAFQLVLDGAVAVAVTGTYIEVD